MTVLVGAVLGSTAVFVLPVDFGSTLPVAVPDVVLVEPDLGSALEVADVCAVLGSTLEVVEWPRAFLGSTLLVAVPAGTDF